MLMEDKDQRRKRGPAKARRQRKRSASADKQTQNDGREEESLYKCALSQGDIMKLGTFTMLNDHELNKTEFRHGQLPPFIKDHRKIR